MLKSVQSEKLQASPKKKYESPQKNKSPEVNTTPLNFKNPQPNLEDQSHQQRGRINQQNRSSSKIRIVQSIPNRNQNLIQPKDPQGSKNIVSKIRYPHQSPYSGIRDSKLNTIHHPSGSSLTLTSLIKKIIKKRIWLTEAASTTGVNFHWKPFSTGFKWNLLCKNNLVINHYKCHKELTCKENLYENLKQYCDKANIDYNEFVPKTFILNLDSEDLESQLKKFLNIFNLESQISNSLWIMKPPNLNRGQGIKIYNNLDKIIEALQLFGQVGALKIEQKHQQLQIKSRVVHFYFKILNELKEFKLQIDSYQEMKQRVVIIQKYIENPLLYGGRKFDFRVWVLMDHERNYYFFREGYLRLSSEQYDQSPNSIDNLFVHLTNNAIQKNHAKYEKYEAGNQLSFDDLQKYFDQKGHNISVKSQLVNSMKKLIRISIESAAEKFQNCQEKFQFEIFGFDFMINSQGKLYLIEVNTNPCLEESSLLVGQLIRRMINDAFRLTIDKILSPQGSAPPLKRHYDFLQEFNIIGYNNQENLWEQLSKL